MNSFCFIDKVTELKKKETLEALYTLKGDEEFLKDHFEGFPVMPGVLLLESLKQAASSLLSASFDLENRFFRLIKADSVKFGQFVRPGSELKIGARFLGREGDSFLCDGWINVGDKKALSASIALAPIR